MKRIFIVGFLTLFVIVIAATVIIINTRKLNNYYDKVVEIGQEDSLSLKVTDVWVNGGYLYLNDSLYIWGSKVDEPNIKVLEIYEIGLPFYLKKTAKSDTLWIKSNKGEYFFILRKD